MKNTLIIFEVFGGKATDGIPFKSMDKFLHRVIVVTLQNFMNLMKLLKSNEKTKFLLVQEGTPAGPLNYEI